jgi:hypothetical protein
MDIQLHRAIATEAQFCSRCRDLGIADPTIMPGTEYIQCPEANMCLECLDRLQAELEVLS